MTMLTIVFGIALIVLLMSGLNVTLPSYSKTIDDAFMQTWTEIQVEAADNILNATVITAWMRKKGVYKPQEGGNSVTRAIEYDVPGTRAVGKGSTMGSGELETKTEYIWDFDRNLSIHVQRSLFGKNGDRANRGKYQIQSYVNQRLERATEGMKQDMESDYFRAHSPTEVGISLAGDAAPRPRSLYDMIPPTATRATGTWGGIARPTSFTSDVPDAGNTFNTPKYQQLSADPEVNLLSDIKNFYNDVTDQIETPDGIFTSQNIFEIYLEFGLDQTQIVGDRELLNLGFSTAKYLDADFVWTKKQTTDDLRFVNSRWMEDVYDPMVWFMATEWEFVPGQLERIMYLLTTHTGPITNQPRRHGLLYT